LSITVADGRREGQARGADEGVGAARVGEAVVAGAAEVGVLQVSLDTGDEGTELDVVADLGAANEASLSLSRGRC
jgi:hypothetical protein